MIHLLQPGIGKSSIDKEIEPLKIDLPDEVYTLYSCKNGTSEGLNYNLGQLWIFPLGQFSSLEDSLRAYRSFVGRDDFWKKEMFMLFMSGGGELFLLDCDKQSPTFKMILLHSVGATDYEVIITIYDSLESLFATTIECLESGAYYYDKSGTLNHDMRKEKVIAKKYNPKSAYWRLYD